MSIAEFDVTGQKVLLVGAGRSIGKGIAQVFAEAGADVAITGMTSTGASKVAEEAHALGTYMLERGQGCVINISGWASFRGRAQYSAYDAAKTGLLRFTECLAQE